MKVKIIPIILLLLFSIAAPVVVSMAIPEGAEDFYYKAVLEPNPLFDLKGVQKFTQGGVLYDIDDNEVGDIVLNGVVTNLGKALSGKCARARVHFIIHFDDEERADIQGTIVGKIWFDEGIQNVDGIFVGRGSHVKGKVSLIDTGDPEEPNVLIFDGVEW